MSGGEGDACCAAVDQSASFMVSLDIVILTEAQGRTNLPVRASVWEKSQRPFATGCLEGNGLSGGKRGDRLLEKKKGTGH